LEFIIRPSRTWIAIAGFLSAFLVGIACLVLLESGTSTPFAFWTAVIMVVVVPVGFFELASRRYQFGPSVVRYRRCFRWSEKQVPMKLGVEFSTYEVITVRDTDTGKKVIVLTREFTRGGKTVEEFAAYYRNMDRTVTIVDEKHA
jgi:hypothetical protein